MPLKAIAAPTSHHTHQPITDQRVTRSPTTSSPRQAGKATSLTRFAGFGMIAATAAFPSAAASISTYEFSLGGSDSLTTVYDSIAASTDSTRILRYRIGLNTISKMASDVPPNTNLVAVGTSVWFTSRDKPYRIGRADLSTITGTPAYYTSPGISSPFDDMTLGPGNALWAANAQSGRVVRVTQSGQVTEFAGDGAIRPSGVARGSDDGMWFADAANRRITRIDAGSGAFTDYPVPQLSAETVPVRVASLPETGPVWFATQDGFGSVDPASGKVEVVATESQQPRRLAAAPDGTVWMTDGTQYVTQFTPPGSFAKLKVFENDDAQSAGLLVDAAGVVYVSDPQGWHLAKIDTARDTPASGNIVEFYNSALGHYFITADAMEAATIDAGAAGAAWARTGESWKAWTGGPVPNATQVCRFYGATDVVPETGARRGPNSHFYTVQPAECAAVKADAGWRYEASARFWMIRPTAGGCPEWTRPVYRAYNNGFATNNSNHRYTVSAAVYQQMVGDGWTGEGIAMCAPAS